MSEYNLDKTEKVFAKGGKTDLTLQRDLKKIKESSSFSKLRPYIRDGKIIIESGYEVYDKTADSGTGAYVEYPEFESSKEIVEALKDVKGRDNKYRITLEKHEEEEPEDSNVEYIAYYYYLTPIGSYAEGGMIDYFEEYELLQKEYPKIYEVVFEQGELTDYKDTERLLKKLNSMGWTFDYGLDNSPYNLRPFAPKMNWPNYKKGGLTSKKARKMLKDGMAQGKPLTAKQKRYFGALASGKEDKIRKRARMKKGGRVNVDKFMPILPLSEKETILKDIAFLENELTKTEDILKHTAIGILLKNKKKKVEK